MALLSNRVISIYNRKTSIRLTPVEWLAINNICHEEKIHRKLLFELIDLNRNEQINLTAAIRLFTLIYYKNATSDTPPVTSTKSFFNPIYEAIKALV